MSIFTDNAQGLISIQRRFAGAHVADEIERRAIARWHSRGARSRKISSRTVEAVMDEMTREVDHGR